jgi:hypothetical protein
MGIICQDTCILPDRSTVTVLIGTAAPYQELKALRPPYFQSESTLLFCDVHGGKAKCVLLDDIFSGFYLSL